MEQLRSIQRLIESLDSTKKCEHPQHAPENTKCSTHVCPGCGKETEIKNKNISLK